MTTTDHKIKDKVTYKEDIRFLLTSEHAKLLPGLKEGDNVKSGDLVIEYTDVCETQEIPNKGKVKVKKGDSIKKGQVITYSGKLLKSKTKSKFEGTVEDITDEIITIKSKPKENARKKELPTAPFEAEIEKSAKNATILKFPGIEINLISSKGNNHIGKLFYISSKDLLDKERDIELPDLNKSIVVTDALHSETYPLLSSLGVSGIIVNHISYEFYNAVILLDVPIGVICGFGDLEEDGTITKYLKSKQGENVWLETDFDRLVIPESKEPSWLKTYEFDLTRTKIIT